MALDRFASAMVIAGQPAICPAITLLAKRLVLVKPPKPIRAFRSYLRRNGVGELLLEIERPCGLPTLQRHIDFLQSSRNFLHPRFKGGFHLLGVLPQRCAKNDQFVQTVRTWYPGTI